jgi:hypothetical protein
LTLKPLTFDGALRALIADPVGVAQQPEAILTCLVKGWGNPLWVAQPAYLAACLWAALDSPGPILECGSGLSTLVLAAAARHTGQPLWVLEHQPRWRQQLQGYVRMHQLPVQITVAPLQDYGPFSWYAPPLTEMPAAFTRVICDGPPGTTPGGRYGLLPIMRARLVPDCLILLDDLHRPEEQAIAARWASERPATLTIVGEDRPYALIQMLKSSDGPFTHAI